MVGQLNKKLSFRAADNCLYFDIGGTHSRSFLVVNNRIYKKYCLATPTSLASFKKVIKQLRFKSDPKTRAFIWRIGIAGTVQGSKVISCANIPWLKNFDFKTITPTGIKVIVDNDARLFLRLALLRYPGLRNGRVLAITLGTGVGRALAVDNQVKIIKAFEHRETWEVDYQRRWFGSAVGPIVWLATHLQPLFKKYQPKTIVLGGGVIHKNKFFRSKLSWEIKKYNKGRLIII